MSCHKQLVAKSTVVAGASVVLMARVVDTVNATLVQSVVSFARVDAYEMENGVRTPVDTAGVEITDGSMYDEPTVASVVYNSLQNDSRWNEDSTGYNVAYKMKAPLPDKAYEVRITFTLSNDDVVVLVFVLLTV